MSDRRGQWSASSDWSIGSVRRVPHGRAPARHAYHIRPRSVADRSCVNAASTTAPAPPSQSQRCPGRWPAPCWSGPPPRRLFDALMACLLGGLAIWLISGGARDDRGGHGPAAGTPRLLTDRDGTTYRYSGRTRRGVAYSVGVGFISSFLGIGGGVIHVPLLVRALGFPVHVATATSHFVLANMAGGRHRDTHRSRQLRRWHWHHRAIALSVGVVGGAQVGAWLSQRMGGVVIQRLLAVALAGLALRLLFTVL
ncbi:MAG: sulfite exporter TauE/SafE family protein [Candidatus Dormibacter sp.]